MKFVFTNGQILNINNEYIKDIDDDNEAFYIEGNDFIYTIYKKDLLNRLLICSLYLVKIFSILLVY